MIPRERTAEITIRGYLVGNIWMPNAECYKDLCYSVNNEEARWSEPGTLRDHVLAATNDGDFQSCRIACGTLVLRTTHRTGTTRTTRERSFQLERFPSIADCLDTEW